MSEEFERRLVAVMFTDVVGYTALMQVDERRAVEKRDRYVDALERQHEAGGGTIVQRLGDGEPVDVPERARGGRGRRGDPARARGR